MQLDGLLCCNAGSEEKKRFAYHLQCAQITNIVEMLRNVESAAKLHFLHLGSAVDNVSAEEASLTLEPALRAKTKLLCVKSIISLHNY